MEPGLACENPHNRGDERATHNIIYQIQQP